MRCNERVVGNSDVMSVANVDMPLRSGQPWPTQVLHYTHTHTYSITARIPTHFIVFCELFYLRTTLVCVLCNSDVTITAVCPDVHVRASR